MWIRIELVPELQTNHVDCMYILYVHFHCSTQRSVPICIQLDHKTTIAQTYRGMIEGESSVNYNKISVYYNYIKM